MILRVQEHLAAIYGLTCEFRATDFLVDPERARSLGATGRAPEELLVREEEGELELGLYLDPELLARMNALEHQPTSEVLERDLEHYCQLTEGVSHLLYLAHTAEQSRRVSLLELEAQAEVDKFASCLLARWHERTVTWAGELAERLFDRVSYRAELLPAETWRYQQANRLARAFCRRLLRHVAARRLDRLLSELRYAYRLGAQAKLEHLAG